MFQLDDQFLIDVGLSDMPDDQKQQFLSYILEQFELKIGEILTEGVPDEKLDEFEGFINRDNEIVNAWLTQNDPAYEQNPIFMQMRDNNPDAEPSAVASEYASLRWLEINRPDYREVVAKVMEDLKKDLIQNRDQLLSA